MRLMFVFEHMLYSLQNGQAKSGYAEKSQMKTSRTCLIAATIVVARNEKYPTDRSGTRRIQEKEFRQTKKAVKILRLNWRSCTSAIDGGDEKRTYIKGCRDMRHRRRIISSSKSFCCFFCDSSGKLSQTNQNVSGNTFLSRACPRASLN